MADNDTMTEAGWVRGALLTGFLAYVFVAGFFEISDPDIGFHIRTGELVVQSRAIPTVNTFSFTQPDQPWLLHQWAPGVLFYFVWKWAGISGLVTLKALVGCAIFLVVFMTARRSAPPMASLYVASAAILFARLRLFERPFLFSALLLAFHVYATHRWTLQRRWLWLGLPALMTIWANIHAGVVYGAVYGACIVAADGLAALSARASDSRGSPITLRTAIEQGCAYAVAIVIALLSVQLVNPSGLAVILLPFTYTLDTFWHNLILEFLPPKWDETRSFFLYLGGVAALLAVQFRSIPLRISLPSVVFAVLAITSQRSILDFAIVSIPCAAMCVAKVVQRLGWRTPRVAAIALPFVWLIAARFCFAEDPRLVPGPGLRAALYPVGIYRFMERELTPQPVFNDMRYGGSMLWFLYPRWRPFIDGRCEAYSRSFWKDTYIPAAAGTPAWKSVFARHAIHAALVNWTFGSPMKQLALALNADTNWTIVAFTDRTILFLERTDENLPAINRFAFEILQPADATFASISPATAHAAMSESLRALDVEPDGFIARTALSKSLLAQQKFQEAATVLATLVGGREVSAPYWRDYLYALFMSKDTRGAERVAAQMIRQAIDPAFAWYIRSYIRESDGMLDAARRSVALEPENASYRERLKEITQNTRN